MINDLKTLYDKWNSKQLKLEDYNDFIEITTPFVDMHHDFIQLFFTKEKNGKYKLTDDGHIIGELSILGLDVTSAKKRKQFFNTTLKIFGVSFDSHTEELFVTFETLEDYPKKQHNLLQCLTRVADMLLTSKNTVASIFSEEISKFFEENNVFFSPDMGFIGKTGNQQTFDFVIPHSKKKREKLIKAVNTPSAENYTSPLISFIDVQEVRPKADFIVVANDFNVPIADKFASSLKNYNVEILAWSNRHDWVDQLKVI